MVQAPPKPEHVPASSNVVAESVPIVLRLPPGVLTDEVLLQISVLNQPWRFERSREGALEISLPTGSIGGIRTMHVAAQLYAWWSESQDGAVFDSSTGFRLPSTSVRAPDAAWASGKSIENMLPDDEGYWPICPELIVEIRSASQDAQPQQEKMQEWMEAGVRLGWLIDPFTADGEVWIYRKGNFEPDRLERPDSLSGEDVAEGLSVDLANVWR